MCYFSSNVVSSMEFQWGIIFFFEKVIFPFTNPKNKHMFHWLSTEWMNVSYAWIESKSCYRYCVRPSGLFRTFSQQNFCAGVAFIRQHTVICCDLDYRLSKHNDVALFQDDKCHLLLRHLDFSHIIALKIRCSFQTCNIKSRRRIIIGWTGSWGEPKI